MSQTLKNVLVIGAGGNLGPSIIHALDSNPQLNLSILSRQSSKSTFPSHIKVQPISDSYPSEELAAAFKDQDAIINLSPLYNLDQAKAFIDAAVKAGVKRYIPAEFGSNSAEPRVMAAVPLFAGKGVVKEYLVSKEKEGLTWTGVLNGGFFDWGIKSNFLGFYLAAQKALIYDSGTATADHTLLSDVGKAVVSILLHPAETANRYVNINTFHTSQNAILKGLEEATGKKWEIEHTTSKEAREEGNRKIAKGDMTGIYVIAAMHWAGDEWSSQYGTDNQLLLGRGTRGEAEMMEVIGKIVKGEEV